jgi:uncharacterized membrane protein
MQHMQDAIHVDAPVEHVWAFYLDTSRWTDWMPRAEYMEFSGPLDQVGTTYVGGMRILGHEMRATYKVVEIVPQRLYREQSDDWGPMETRIRFEPEGDGTLVKMESDYEMPHLPKVLQDLMSRHWMERQVHQMLGDFKALAEATVPVPA